MIIQEKAMMILELHKVIEELLTYASTPPGREKVAGLRPAVALAPVLRLQKETSEAVVIIRENRLPFPSCEDILPYLLRAERGSLLAPRELMEIGFFIKASAQVKDAFSNQEYTAERFPLFYNYILKLAYFPSIRGELERTFYESGEIRENATALLGSLRREERVLQDKIHKCMETYLRSPHYRKYLQEHVVTIRGDRYVLPVKQECRSYVPGLVHDQSASGQTLFIEPLPAVELNNQLKLVKNQIDGEIERILHRLTLLVADKAGVMSETFQIYGELDYILARGYLSIEQGAREPVLNDNGFLRIVKGRHPLLEKGAAIPVDLYLGGDFNTLVITGPNTGGKTVTLKIIGLFTLMAQCGLHLPAESGTEMGIFTDVWADIGDEQNVEQSLSTFSGHIKNVIQILKGATSSSLVLLDEIGAGTDPSEGSALAMAILDELHLRGVKTAATTHINEIKVFAHLREGMENASMEFDSATMAPTYHLMIGVPGQSNAMAIAERLGLPAGLIAQAHLFIRKDIFDMEDVVSSLAEERQKAAEYSRLIEEMKMSIEIRLNEIEEIKRQLEEKRKEFLQKARQESQTMIRSTKRRTEDILKKLYQAEREKSGEEALLLGEEARSDLKALQQDFFQQEEEENIEIYRVLKAEDLYEGREVYLISLRSYGEIIRIYSEDEIQVQTGALKVNTRLKDLALPEGKKNAVNKNKEGPVLNKRTSQMDLIQEKSDSLRPRLDIRGMTLDEGVLTLEKYLDDAILTGLQSFDIIHGKGTGRLRQGIHQYLKNLNRVAAFRLGQDGEGGSGVTIVKIRN